MENSLYHLRCKLGLEKRVDCHRRAPGDQGEEQSARDLMEVPSCNDQDPGENKIKLGKAGQRLEWEELEREEEGGGGVAVSVRVQLGTV